IQKILKHTSDFEALLFFVICREISSHNIKSNHDSQHTNTSLFLFSCNK
ncbi:MAG: hypothetical protein ACI90V_001954, partial [Bacillariaceae sp.]